MGDEFEVSDEVIALAARRLCIMRDQDPDELLGSGEIKHCRASFVENEIHNFLQITQALARALKELEQ